VQTTVSVIQGQGYLSGVPPAVLEEVHKATRFRPSGYQFNPQFKRFTGTGADRRRVWDGYVKLVKHSKFPAGLLERVLEVLQKNGIEAQIQIDSPQDFPTISVNSHGLQSRDYQDRAVESALMSRRGVVRAPTGSGKTAIQARVIDGLKRQAVVIVPTIDLLKQTRRFLEEHLEVEGGIGQLGDGVVDPRLVTVATVRTMAKAVDVAFSSYEFGEYDDKDATDLTPARLRDWVKSIAVVLVDEAHILGAQVVYDIVTKLGATHKFGFSASPWRDDGADLMIEAATGPLLYRIGTKELVDDGWLVPPIIEVVDTNGLWVPGAWGKEEFGKAYKQEIVENPVRNQLIADKTNRFETPSLVLVKQINHGRMLEGMIEGSHFLSGKATSEERDDAYDAMRDGELNTIIATTIADLGLDLPICRNLVLAGGGKSSTRHLQRIGRVARPYPGKEWAKVVDFDDTHVHRWFQGHAKARRRIEHAEWDESAIWI
jgi:superfamily II DNA or RNA helicase